MANPRVGTGGGWPRTAENTSLMRSISRRSSSVRRSSSFRASRAAITSFALFTSPCPLHFLAVGSMATESVAPQLLCCLPLHLTLFSSPCSRHIVAVGSVVTESECTSAAFSSISSFAVHLCRSQQDDGERSMPEKVSAPVAG